MFRTLRTTAALFCLPAILMLEPGCTQTPDRSAPAGAAPAVSLAMIVSGGDDDAFGTSASAALVRVHAITGAHYTVIPAVGSGHQTLQTAMLTDYDETFVVGSQFADAVAHSAHDYPKRWFAIVGARVDEPNVASATFREDDGAWLAGAYAGLRTTERVVGIAVASDAPPDIVAAFRRGVAHANPRAIVRVGGIGDSAALASAGADVVFVADATVDFGAHPPHATLIGVSFGDAPVIAPWSARVTFLPGPAVTRIAVEVAARKPRSGTLDFGAREGAVVLRLAPAEKPYASKAAQFASVLVGGGGPAR
jgi:basic membrane lipoprotein Med (substrate-binding protein (PBP1-ABC) superfamily)